MYSSDPGRVLGLCWRVLNVVSMCVEDMAFISFPETVPGSCVSDCKKHGKNRNRFRNLFVLCVSLERRRRYDAAQRRWTTLYSVG